ncbi:DUF4132 domain-containing protein [Actinomadura violacea]|uniref:DUF4132 domain-containing protein n=1 Tax=Actinomadura violacea TaxID=2819934 RepID=A0ABS3RXL2_9ACTN|nr:DUF4132 domain-containing protein [Actinomadura violacea]MBO2461391.1 DUF4132 domain-containing protein [Actinomadura violacea]
MDDLPVPDEDALILPDAWRRRMLPRRGGRPGPAIKIDRDAGAWLRERVRVIEAERPVREWDGVGPDLAAAAGEYLDGAANPLGAAVVAAVVAEDARWDHTVGRLAAPLADAWVTEHGLPFAACAFAELSRIRWSVPGLRADGAAEGPGRSVASTSAWRIGARLRAMLAVAGDDEYAEAVDGLARCRRGVAQRTVVSFLVPSRLDWVDECCAAPPDRSEGVFLWMLHCALGEPRHVEALASHGLLFPQWDRSCLVTVLDGVGAAAVPLFAGVYDANDWDTDLRKLILEMLAITPGDEAFQALVDRAGQKHVRPALLAAMKRFPVRALRLLEPAAADAPHLAELLAGHVRSHPELAAAAGMVVDDEGRLPDAPVDALPRPLADPPWLRGTKPVKPVVIEGLVPPAGPAVRWEPGEQEEWARTDERHRVPASDDWDALVEEFRTGRAHGYGFGVLTHGPVEKVRPWLADWKPRLWEAEMWLRPVVARFGVDALPVALRIAEEDPAGLSDRALPFLDAGVARFMAGALGRPKKGRKTALAWFGRHGVDAVPLLVPAALGKPVGPRREAEAALRLLAENHGIDEVVEAAARAHGDEAADAVRAFLAVDPLELLPKRIPVVGEWAVAETLPQIRLRGRDDALPVEAVRHLLTMLAMSKNDEVYAGVGIVKDACDPESLAAFAWALFEQWRRNEAPAKDGWALAQLGWLGDDDTARRLTPLIRAWPGEDGHSKAVVGLDVLAAIGTDIALMQLYGISQKVKFKGLKARAQDKVQEVADGLGLTAEQLGDRLVPDFGLDAGGGLVLDYGPRRFVVGFDEQLRPQVADEDGTRRKALPKPGAKDDPELAPAAYKRFAALKKDVRTVAADQIRRLEAAMVARRRWTAGEFRRLFVEHPLIAHVARRLVWVAEDGGKAASFRIAEDGTFADAADDVVALPESAAVGIPHPLELGGSVEAWSVLFADYAILQPFPQLGREVHTLTEAERAARRLARFEDAGVDPSAVLALERRGWRRGGPMDAGIQHSVYRAAPSGLFVNVHLNPGLSIYPELADGQRLEVIWLDDRPETGDWVAREGRRPFTDLDPVTTSEVLAELAAAVS